MGHAVTIGRDIAKSVFRVHGKDASGGVVIRRQVRRAHLLWFFAKQPKCLIDVEACASVHYWGRELSYLGHRVRLMPPSMAEFGLVAPIGREGLQSLIKRRPRALPRQRDARRGG